MFDSSFFVAVSFLIFVGLVVYLGLPKIIINALDQRSKDIKKELDEARNLREEAQKILAKEKKNLDKAEEDAKILLSKAEIKVNEMTELAERNLKEDIERKKKIAEMKIEQAKSEALSDVKSKITELSFEITKDYLLNNIDKEISDKIVSDSITEIKKNL